MKKTVIINMDITKNTINRDLIEMRRIRNMYNRDQITYTQAMDLFQDYLLQTRGRYAAEHVEFPYKLNKAA